MQPTVPETEFQLRSHTWGCFCRRAISWSLESNVTSGLRAGTWAHILGGDGAISAHSSFHSSCDDFPPLGVARPEAAAARCMHNRLKAASQACVLQYAGKMRVALAAQ